MNNSPDFSSYNYEIIQELGRNREGGRISYLARKLDAEERVVIKQFRFVQTDTTWQGFKAHEREIQILQELAHPRIPKYIDSFETVDGFCMVQEYKDAPSLSSKKSFYLKDIEKIIISILEILVDLQERIPPIVHRDIKPENILVDGENNAYLIDFGLARNIDRELALSSVVAGTPGFMPPEELFNRPFTNASDLYSLGATIICLLTNTSSGELTNLIDESYRFNFHHLIRGVNPQFLNWLDRAIAPNLQERFADAKTALNELKTIDINAQALQVISTSKKKSQPVSQPVLLTFLSLFGAVVSSIVIASIWSNKSTIQNQTQETVTASIVNTNSATGGEQWFNNIKSRCNSLEIVTTLRSSTPPNSYEGYAYQAACYAIAGKIDLADKAIQELPENARAYAAGIVFNIGHPIADAGDDESASPIMRLVLKYWPENYMALYHAGISEYILNDWQLSKQHLEQFLIAYSTNDGWRQNAQTVLNRIKNNLTAKSQPVLNLNPE
jgi:serine/threonine protein kinase